MCSGSFSIFSVLGETPLRKIVVPKWWAFVVLNSYINAERVIKGGADQTGLLGTLHVVR